MGLRCFAQSKGSSVPDEVDLQVIVEATQQPLIKSFPCLRIFLRKKIEGKGKQIEKRSKLDKEVVQLKFKGNQKQFELNAELDAIFEGIAQNLSQIKKLSQEGRQRI